MVSKSFKRDFKTSFDLCNHSQKPHLPFLRKHKNNLFYFLHNLSKHNSQNSSGYDFDISCISFYMISKRKTKNYASYRILLSICTSANSGKIQGYLLKDALDWKNQLWEQNTSSSSGSPTHSLSTKKLPTFMTQRLIISSYEFYIQEKF